MRAPQNAARARYLPILFLLTINIILGLYTFRDYGLSWDEPLFYDYARALGYAYTPREWFGGDFNLENAYGPSGSDHANRGPAYLLLARQPVYLLENLGLDEASAWHLVNFISFQLGVYLLYRLALRWIKPGGAFASASLFAWQPLLWGHAFINPKDPPFLVFFLAAILTGFNMVDAVAVQARDKKWKILLAGFILGIATSIRVLGPLAGLLVLVYAFGTIRSPAGQSGSDPSLSFRNWLGRFVPSLIVYLVFSAIITLATWPYLWPNPIDRFIEVSNFMSANPTQLAVLFNGQLFPADELPRRYLPVMLGLTLTEPVWPLFVTGLVVAYFKFRSARLLGHPKLDILTMLLWFLLPFGYVLLRKPPMYDGFRHFLFMLPPVFIFAGFSTEWILDRVRSHWIAAALGLAILLPGVLPVFQLHPYEYTYYNSGIGGTSGAFRRFETDYWLTCYKEAVEKFTINTPGRAQLFVKREPYIAAYYADASIEIKDYREEAGEIQTGDFLLVNTRANEDLKTFRNAPSVLEITRGEAVFCLIKQIP